MDTRALAQSLTKNTNVQDALVNYLMWLSHYPQDYKGATEAASDFIDNTSEVTELTKCLKKLSS